MENRHTRVNLLRMARVLAAIVMLVGATSLAFSQSAEQEAPAAAKKAKEVCCDEGDHLRSGERQTPQANRC